MKEDVVAANLANLRQSINELKECVNRQNVTPTYSGAYPFTFRQLIRV